MHSNLCMVTTPKSHLVTFLAAIYPPLLVEKDKEHLVYPWKDKMFEFLEESGNFHILATKPDTIGKSDYFQKTNSNTQLYLLIH